MTDPEMGARCGVCGGNLLMATCNMFRSTDHDWVLMSACDICHAIYWVPGGCATCEYEETGIMRHRLDFDPETAGKWRTTNEEDWGA